MEVSCATWNLRAVSLWIVMTDLNVIMLNLDRYVVSLGALERNLRWHALTIHQLPAGWYRTVRLHRFIGVTADWIALDNVALCVNVLDMHCLGICRVGDRHWRVLRLARNRLSPNRGLTWRVAINCWHLVCWPFGCCPVAVDH